MQKNQDRAPKHGDDYQEQTLKDLKEVVSGEQNLGIGKDVAEEFFH